MDAAVLGNALEYTGLIPCVCVHVKERQREREQEGERQTTSGSDHEGARIE